MSTPILINMVSQSSLNKALVSPPILSCPPSPLRTVRSYRLRPRNTTGQVIKAPPSLNVDPSRLNPQVVLNDMTRLVSNPVVSQHNAVADTAPSFQSVSRDQLSPKVVLEDISHLCEAVQPLEKDVPVENHSVDPSLVKDKRFLHSLPDRLPISWPGMSDKSAWESFEDTIMKHLSLAS